MSVSVTISIHIIPNNLNEEDMDVVIDEIVNDEDFQKSGKEIETYESIDELKCTQEYEDCGIIILDELSEQKRNDLRVQAMLKRSRHKTLSTFINSQEYYETTKRTIRATGTFYHIFKPNNFRDIQNFNQDKARLDMKLNDFKLLTWICWNEKYQPLTIDMTMDKYTGRYRPGLNSSFVPNSTPF